jgi:hypothetical protein
MQSQPAIAPNQKPTNNLRLTAETKSRKMPDTGTSCGKHAGCRRWFQDELMTNSGFQPSVIAELD